MVPLVVLGPDYDSLFCKPQCELEREVSEFNQSTRVWLGVKFVRKLPIDFPTNIKLDFRYSSRKICELLDVNRTTVYRLINDVRHKNVSVLRMAFCYNYLSPTEYCAFGQEKYFRRIASNYQDLVDCDFFVCTKENTEWCPHKKK